MLMKDILNVFQADWASTPGMKYEDYFQLKPENLKNKPFRYNKILNIISQNIKKVPAFN